MLILNSPRSQACILERNLSFTNPPKVTADSVCCPPIGWHSLNSTRNSEHLTCNKNFRSLTPCTLSDRSHGKEKGGLLNSFHTTRDVALMTAGAVEGVSGVITVLSVPFLYVSRAQQLDWAWVGKPEILSEHHSGMLSLVSSDKFR